MSDSGTRRNGLPYLGRGHQCHSSGLVIFSAGEKGMISVTNVGTK
jgi:hypothetical protein